MSSAASFNCVTKSFDFSPSFDILTIPSSSKSANTSASSRPVASATIFAFSANSEISGSSAPMRIYVLSHYLRILSGCFNLLNRLNGNHRRNLLWIGFTKQHGSPFLAISDDYAVICHVFKTPVPTIYSLLSHSATAFRLSGSSPSSIGGFRGSKPNSSMKSSRPITRRFLPSST